MRIFTPRQRYRILIAHGARIIVGDLLVPLPAYAWETESETERFKLLRRMACVAKCACGCDVWHPLRDIRFDHHLAYVFGGRTELENGRPVATQCHAEKSASEHRANAKAKRIGKKHHAQATHEVSDHRQDSQARFFKSSSVTAQRRPWPTRSLTNPNWKQLVGGGVERRS